MATEITVSSLSSLESALAAAKGGEIIKLLDGYYGSITLSKDFTSKVTIEAINPHKVTFSDIDVPGGSNIHLDGLIIESQPRIDQNAHHVTISNSILKNALYIRDADNIVIDNNDISGGQSTLILNDVTNFRITENYIHHATADVVRITGASKYGLFENNTVYDVAAAPLVHPDLVQMFGTSTGIPTDITFRGNHLYDDPTTGSVYAQGFFFGDPNNGGYKNILIENNLINVGSPNSIAIHGGQVNVVIQHNTLIPWPDGGGAIIRLTDARGWTNEGTTVQDNIAKSILNQTNVPNVSGNYFYGSNADLSKLFSGDGNQWQDFVPVGGSPIDLSTGLGASDRLTDLLNGTSSSGSTPPTPEQPAPTPEPTPEQPAPTPEPTPEQPAPTPEDNTGGTDQGQIDSSLNGVAYAAMGAHEFTSASDVIEVAHNSNLALDAATVSFSFNADTVSGTHGLFSKDASYYTGGGNHLVSYIENGNLIVRFQDGANDDFARIGGIKADTDYDLQVSFGDGNTSVWLNGAQVHSADFSTSWTNNVEYLQFGARGWSSESGEAGFSNVFDGTISDIIVAEGNLTPAQFQNLLSDALADSGTVGGTPTPESPPTDIIANVVYEQAAEQTFTGKTASIVNLEHDAAYEVPEGTISFTFNADDLRGTQGLFSKDAFHYAGGGNHLSVMLKGDSLYLVFQDEDSDMAFRAPGIKAGQDYDVQTWFGDGEVGLAVNGELIGSKAFEVDLSLNHQNLQVGGLGWTSSNGGDTISNAFAGTISDLVIIDQAVSIDHGDLIV
ncbi:right-handed parallel beta-helix repeat-containing protein [uncultured Roseovarius sp.]|uniref:right-handed parallel beta-helix repeat-containing protein n=1 Tax=uncultured Roseovarius sp. TaxID=293344 RepID=UPI002617C375|nr:right-handed parallel beta-helix repeat-containing protein [uncultured Roseovarius sp.]